MKPLRLVVVALTLFTLIVTNIAVTPATSAETPQPVCTPPPCTAGEVYHCPGGPDGCPGGCGTQCATPAPVYETGWLPDDYYLAAKISLVWRDEDGVIPCEGTYVEEAVPSEGSGNGDSGMVVHIEERWDDCPVRPQDVSAQIRVDPATGQWLDAGEAVTGRWGWRPSVARREPPTAYFEIARGQPVPVFIAESASDGIETKTAYDHDGVWLWALRREEVREGTTPVATVWEAWSVNTTTRWLQATAGLAHPLQREAWWAHRLWLGPYSVETTDWLAFQTFTGGQMIYAENDGTIRVLRDLDHLYRSYEDTWTERVTICPGADRLDPPIIRGFGNVWCTNEGEFPRSIGIPLELEWGKDAITLPCEGGYVFRKHEHGDIVLLPHGQWFAVQ